jgi:hypothetical protein
MVHEASKPVAIGLRCCSVANNRCRSDTMSQGPLARVEGPYTEYKIYPKSRRLCDPSKRPDREGVKRVVGQFATWPRLKPKLRGVSAVEGRHRRGCAMRCPKEFPRANSKISGALGRLLDFGV